MNLLWIGDAACGSGFGRASHHILNELRHLFKVSVIAMNYRGDPHPDRELYDIYPAHLPDGDALGLGRLPHLLPKIKPDLIVLQSNPWHFPVFHYQLHKHGFGNIPTVGIVAVEGKNCRGDQLNRLQKAIFWTEFGRNEAVQGGMTVPSAVIPLGVDLEIYKPGDKEAARKKIGLKSVPEGAFFVTNVNRNQTRKRLDLTIMFFAEWITTRVIRDAYLYLHAVPGSSVAVDCDRLGFYCGISDRLILAEPKDVFNGSPEEYVVASYQAADVYLTTALGEGFGLTALEAMACGKPVVAGDYAALGEWAKGAAWLVKCNSEGVMPDVNMMIGNAPEKAAVIDALDTLYRNKNVYQTFAENSLACARQPMFDWKKIALQFAQAIETSI